MIDTEELRRLLEAATPGPWDWSGTCLGHDTGPNTRTCIWHEDGEVGPNHRLIAAAITALPELLDAAEFILPGVENARDIALDRAKKAEAEAARLTHERDEAVKAFHEATALRSQIQQARIKAENERDEARAVLRDVEWSSTATWYDAAGVDHEVDNCPVCGALKEKSAAGDGVHVGDCALARALGGGGK